jgi:hypothetical protein
MSRVRSAALALALGAAAVAATAAPAQAYVDPPGCPQSVEFASDIPTFEEVTGIELGAGGTGSTPRNLTAVIYQYFDAVVEATEDNDRVKVIRKSFGTSVMGKDLRFYVVSTPDNIDNLDTGRADGPFWEGIKDGSVSEAAGLAAVSSRPAMGWITATPHGGEAAAAEAISKMLYELTARVDCWNLRRLAVMDLFLMPVRNPDGRDAPPGGVRTSAWAFDHNRDFGTQNQVENGAFLPLLKRYPGLFYIDAHQQSTGYFFPPNEDPVHHEVSDFSLDFIQHRIGPALQQKFNDQSTAYRNYNTYDLFVPEYGDSVPSLLSGAAGMTFEKGTSEVYGKQVYDHYLAIDETVNVTVRDKVALLASWTEQWQEAVDQGEDCTLQPNKLVSPISETILREVPTGPQVCGYFYRPDNHAGDTSELLRHMQRQGVHVYRFDQAATIAGREFGQDAPSPMSLPAGTLYIPMDQPLKHWIQAVLGEDPYQPLNFFYDVAQWSYSLQRGQSGNGILVAQPSAVAMTEVADPGFGSAPAATSPVYAFDTDSMQSLAMVTELLDAGVVVSRGAAAFDAAGKHFETGAALVDGASLAGSGVNLQALAGKRQTPVSGLSGYPVERYAMGTPKIGLYTANAFEPNNPVRPLAGSAYPQHCGVQPGGTASATAYCAALFTLTSKMKLPASMVAPVTTTDLAAGALISGGFTAFVNPGATIAAGAGATALQAFVAAGGRYVGTLAGGTTSARNAGLTLLNTASTTGWGLSTPGSFFPAAIDTSSPVAWGFDNGGFIYRETTGDPVYDGDTLGTAKAAFKYADPLKSFGFAQGALDAGRLPGRPAVVDQPFGNGRAVMLGFDPFFRAWRESDERIVLNAVLAPSGAPLAPSAPAPKRVAPISLDDVPADLPAVKARPLAAKNTTARDVRIRVARKDAAKLKRAVKAAKLPKRLQRKVRWIRNRRTVTFVVKRVRTQANQHERGVWVGKITRELEKRKVNILLGQF